MKFDIKSLASLCKCSILTAGDDQLPQQSANVIKGSEHSNPNTLRALISSFFTAFGQV